MNSDTPNVFLLHQFSLEKKMNLWSKLINLPNITRRLFFYTSHENNFFSLGGIVILFTHQKVICLLFSHTRFILSFRKIKPKKWELYIIQKHSNTIQLIQYNFIYKSQYWLFLKRCRKPRAIETSLFPVYLYNRQGRKRQCMSI